MVDYSTISAVIGGSLVTGLLARYGGAWAGATLAWLSRRMAQSSATAVKQVEASANVEIARIHDQTTREAALWAQIARLEERRDKREGEHRAELKAAQNEADEWQRRWLACAQRCPELIADAETEQRERQPPQLPESVKQRMQQVDRREEGE